ncbi:hypothetical protein TRIUR3_25280 [Triticum urartu]|uniref:Uncharacterized protein n=1 Tax=Triticum urartu TaxID=4572 RepID=M7Z244_TRIUA|nr:hypothetical protein TRIUR3_25280 [Triticum urartu]
MAPAAVELPAARSLSLFPLPHVCSRWVEQLDALGSHGRRRQPPPPWPRRTLLPARRCEPPPAPSHGRRRVRGSNGQRERGRGG